MAHAMMLVAKDNYPHFPYFTVTNGQFNSWKGIKPKRPSDAAIWLLKNWANSVYIRAGGDNSPHSQMGCDPFSAFHDIMVTGKTFDLFTMTYKDLVLSQMIDGLESKMLALPSKSNMYLAKYFLWLNEIVSAPNTYNISGVPSTWTKNCLHGICMTPNLESGRQSREKFWKTYPNFNKQNPTKAIFDGDDSQRHVIRWRGFEIVLQTMFIFKKRRELIFNDKSAKQRYDNDVDLMRKNIKKRWQHRNVYEEKKDDDEHTTFDDQENKDEEPYNTVLHISETPGGPKKDKKDEFVIVDGINNLNLKEKKETPGGLPEFNVLSGQYKQ